MRSSKNHNIINLLSVTGIRVLVAASVMLGSILVLYSGYSLYEQLYTQNRAFSTAGLEYDGEEVLLEDVQEDLAATYEEYRAWLRVDDTHIDYPVMQHTDDLYYASHDIDGNSSLTGAIYMAFDNAADLSDNYTVIFGHHMDHGAMFGDLDKFLEQDFFDAHRKGTLASPGGIYDIELWAVLSTDAYDAEIYTVGNRDLAEVIQYVADHAELYDAAAAKDAEKIVVLSTCAGAQTNGRLVLIGSLKPYIIPIEPTTAEQSSEESTPEVSTEEITTPEASTEEISTPEASTEESTEEPTKQGAAIESMSPDEPTTPDGTVPEGTAAGTGVNERWPIFSGFFEWFMPGGSSYGRNAWAFVNLICLLITIYILAPVTQMKRKYGRIRKMRKVNEAKQEEIYDVEPFARRFHTGVAIEAVLTVLAVLAFFFTENMRLPMILIDKYTPLMLILMIGAWVADVTLTRYRRDDQEKVKQEQE